VQTLEKPLIPAAFFRSRRIPAPKCARQPPEGTVPFVFPNWYSGLLILEPALRAGFVIIAQLSESQQIKHMETKHKESYEAPETTVLKLRLQGVIAVSDPRFNSPFDEEQNM
jgi:hypothetical protein